MTKIVSTGDDEEDKKLKAAALEAAEEYADQQKRSLRRAKNAMEAVALKKGANSQAAKDAKTAYYEQKAAYDKLAGLLASAGKKAKDAAAALDASTYGGELDEFAKADIRKEIEEFKNWAKDGDKTEEEGLLLL